MWRQFLKNNKTNSAVIPVETAQGSSYDVLIKQNSLSSLSDLLSEYAHSHRYAIISDNTVGKLYGLTMRNKLRSEGLNVDLFTFTQGEENKTRRTWCDLTDQMLVESFGRDSCVLALGGGVVGDLAGFVAATYMSGIPVVQIPTSLVAMIDASVGGKTGVDVSVGKNLVGTFHPPELVVVDPEVVCTLPVEECKQGLVEAVKHGIIMDATYFTHLSEVIPELLSKDVDQIEDAVLRSVELKAMVVSEDERERGKREILNFGHTFGHAIEAAHEYSLSHGVAVGHGMLLEIILGIRLGLTNPEALGPVKQCLSQLGISFQSTLNIDSEKIMRYLRMDKKSKLGGRRFVLISEIGAVLESTEGWSHTVDERTLTDFWKSL